MTATNSVLNGAKRLASFLQFYRTAVPLFNGMEKNGRVAPVRRRRVDEEMNSLNFI